MIGERRLATLRELAARARRRQDASRRCWRRSSAASAPTRRDLPFTLHLPVRRRTERRGWPARPASQPAIRRRRRLIDAADARDLARRRSCCDRARRVAVDDWTALRARCRRRLGPSRRARRSWCPIAQQGQERPAGFLVAGLNPYRPLDAAYRGLHRLVAGQIAAGLANAQRLRGGAPARRGAGRDRPREDRILLERQPRVPHAADADARPAGGAAGRAAAGDAAARGDWSRSRIATACACSSWSTRCSTSRASRPGACRRRYEPTDLARVHRGPRVELPLGDGTRRPASRRRLPHRCREPVYVDRDMWEKIVLNSLQRVQVHVRRASITRRGPAAGRRPR